MAQGNIVLARWKCIIDGVEVPLIGGSIQHGIGANAFASIKIEPDPALRYIPKNCHVKLSFRDDVDPDIRARLARGEAVDDLDLYKVYFEGETVAQGNAWAPDARFFELTAAGHLLVLSDTDMFMGGVGNAFETPLVSGSFLFGSQTDVGDTIVKSFLGQAFANDPGKYGAATRIVQLINYLCCFNASARLRTVRTRLLGRIAAVDDKFLGSLIQFSLAGLYMGQTANTIGADSTFMDVINQMMALTFHTVCPIPAPYFPDQQTGPEKVQLPTFTGLEDIYAIRIPYRRHDYVFAPNLYYAMPPSSNIFFPDMLTGVKASWEYRNQPTRLLVVDKYVTQGGVGFIAPQPPIRDSVARLNPKAAALWATSLDAVRTDNTGALDSPYRITLGGDRFNGLQMLRDEELERGIVLSREFPEYEFFSALAAETQRELNANPDKVLKEAIEAAKTGIDNEVDPATGRSSTGAAGARWVKTMNAAAAYQLELQRNRRQVSISAVGLRHVIPGFPAIVLGHEVSFHGRVVSVTLTIDPTGLETTTIELDYAREIRYPQSTTQRDSRDAQMAARVIARVNTLIDGVLRIARNEASEALDGSEAQRSAASAQLVRIARTVGVSAGLRNQVSLDPTSVTRSAVEDVLGAVEAAAADARNDVAAGTLTVALTGFGGMQSDVDAVNAARVQASAGTLDSPAPPPHFPIEFVRNTDLNRRYAELFGQRKALYPESPPAQPFDDVQTLFNPEQQDAMSRINAVFAIDPTKNPGSVQASEWTKRATDSRSRLDWELSDFHWRPAQSLRSWAAVNGLVPSTQTAEAGGQFIVMTPIQPDDSIIAKIVNEPGVDDPLIAEIRAEVDANPESRARLTTEGRQSIWLDYARRHFGGRAYPGN